MTEVINAKIYDALKGCETMLSTKRIAQRAGIDTTSENLLEIRERLLTSVNEGVVEYKTVIKDGLYTKVFKFK